MLAKFVFTLLLIAVVVLAYVFMPTSGREYPLNRTAMQAVLASIEIPPVFTDPSQRLKLVASDGSHVAWELGTGIGPSIRVVAQIEAVSPQTTKATVIVTQPELGKNGPNALAKAGIKKIFESAFKEQIDARVEGRDFESYRLAPELVLMMVIATTTM